MGRTLRVIHLRAEKKGMFLMRQTICRNAIALVLGLTLSAVASAHDGEYGGKRRVQWIEMQGYILATSSSTPQKHARFRAASTSYVLLHQHGSLILQASKGQPSLPYHRLWLKGEDAMLTTLVAEEQLFLQVRIAGVLREYAPDTGILDLVQIEVVPVYAQEQSEDE